ncbi:MAG: tetratricopeptide repeat protein, partial [Alphaproteobacteria bacterium]|nr:tetratricopeptide repeat protein [Alphaproteobacteria bacterium]
GSAQARGVLGVALRAAARHAEAIAIFEGLARDEPLSHRAHNNLGNALRSANRPAEAMGPYRVALGLAPDFAEAMNNAGLALRDLGDHARSADHLRWARRLVPGNPDIAANWGTALVEQDRLDEAMAVFREALALGGNSPALANNLALALAKAGRRELARALLAETFDRMPDSPDLGNNLATLLMNMGAYEEAERIYREVLRKAPRHKESWGNLGYMMQTLGRMADAEFAFRSALAIDPDHIQGLYGLGIVNRDLLRFEEAVALSSRAAELAPNDPVPLNNKAIALVDLGQIGEAVAAYRQAIAMENGKDPTFFSNYLLALQYFDDVSNGTLFAEHRRWDALFGGTEKPPAGHANTRDPERRLRVGYVSADFRWHSVAYFIEPVMAAHDREQVHVTCYHVSPRSDRFTARIKAAADSWREVAGLSPEDLDALVREDGIDILVDLAGHTGNNRLTTFARRPAPVQVTWIGYPATTGLSAMTHRLTDAAADPPGEADRLHSERLVRLPGAFLCFKPVDADEPVAPPSFDEIGNVTFGSFNNAPKLSPSVIGAWARVLRAVPGSGLLLKARGLGSPSGRRRVEEAFAAHGIPASRLRLDGFAGSARDHLARYGAVDVGLDTFPYNGTTTTFEALWMGVPVVTLRGDRHAGRVGASILGALGLDELIAADVDSYVETAVRLAGDAPRLRAYRATLRDRLATSALCDARGFTATLESALRAIWRDWCAGGG